eukprot:320447-Chlamydomonas_euryale.AAC.11
MGQWWGGWGCSCEQCGKLRSVTSAPGGAGNSVKRAALRVLAYRSLTAKNGRRAGLRGPQVAPGGLSWMLLLGTVLIRPQNPTPTSP